MTILFAGHEDLLQGFNAFLPEGHKMPGPAAPPPALNAPPFLGGGNPAVGGAMGGFLGGMGPGGGDVNYAFNFVAKVKQRFAREPDKYKLFLEVLHQ